MTWQPQIGHLFNQDFRFGDQELKVEEHLSEELIDAIVSEHRCKPEFCRGCRDIERIQLSYSEDDEPDGTGLFVDVWYYNYAFKTGMWHHLGSVEEVCDWYDELQEEEDV